MTSAKKQPIATLAIAAIAACSWMVLPASAQERDATAVESSKVISKLRSLGYRSITDVDVVGTRFIVDARSPTGKDVDVVIDRRTLKILRVNPS